MDDTFYTQWDDVVCSLKDKGLGAYCNIHLLRIGSNKKKTNNKHYIFKVLYK